MCFIAYTAKIANPTRHGKCAVNICGDHSQNQTIQTSISFIHVSLISISLNFLPARLPDNNPNMHAVLSSNDIMYGNCRFNVNISPKIYVCNPAVKHPLIAPQNKTNTSSHRLTGWRRLTPLNRLTYNANFATSMDIKYPDIVGV